MELLTNPTTEQQTNYRIDVWENKACSTLFPDQIWIRNEDKFFLQNNPEIKLPAEAFKQSENVVIHTIFDPYHNRHFTTGEKVQAECCDIDLGLVTILKFCHFDDDGLMVRVQTDVNEILWIYLNEIHPNRKAVAQTHYKEPIYLNEIVYLAYRGATKEPVVEAVGSEALNWFHSKHRAIFKTKEEAEAWIKPVFRAKDGYEMWAGDTIHVVSKDLTYLGSREVLECDTLTDAHYFANRANAEQYIFLNEKHFSLGDLMQAGVTGMELSKLCTKLLNDEVRQIFVMLKRTA